MARQRIPITKSMAKTIHVEETTPRHQHKHPPKVMSRFQETTKNH